MQLRLAAALLTVFAGTGLFSQVPDTNMKGIHQEQSEYYSTQKIKIPAPTKEGLEYPAALRPREAGSLPRMVLGWHPYWASPIAYLGYDYNVLSHLAYFSYEVDTATGGYTSVHEWNTTPIISYAHQKGSKVLLTVTNFGTARNTELLSDTVKQNLLIGNLISLLKSRNGDGVNFDLESVSLSQKANLVNFMSKAATRIKAEIPAAEISMATPAVDWSGSWDLKKLSEVCDYLVVMGYNYYWSGSSTAGPVAPLTGETYNVTRSVDTYISAGVKPERLALGVPWYGYDWPVMGEGRKSTTTGTGTSRTYSNSQQIAASFNKVFDMSTSVPRVSYYLSTGWRQMWYEDTLSLSLKYEMAESKDLAGIGIWALSYEGSYDDVWSTIDNAFSEHIAYTYKLKVYPNPATGISKAGFSLASGGRIKLEIFSLTGILEKKILDEWLEAGEYSGDIDTRQLSQGVHLCVLRKGNMSITAKLVVIK